MDLNLLQASAAHETEVASVRAHLSTEDAPAQRMASPGLAIGKVETGEPLLPRHKHSVLIEPNRVVPSLRELPAHVVGLQVNQGAASAPNHHRQRPRHRKRLTDAVGRRGWRAFGRIRHRTGGVGRWCPLT